MRRRLLSVIALTLSVYPFAHSQTTVTNPASPWVVPANVYSITIECWGGGGGSGGASCAWGDATGGGGGGGAYSRQVFAVTPGQSFTITIGAGGTAGNSSGGNGGSGNTTTVSGVPGTCSAFGGGGGFGSTSGNGAGGAGGNGGNGFLFRGGNGSAGTIGTWNYGGGGGGSAGTGSNGNNASGSTGGAAVAGGVAGRNGVANNSNGNTGNAGGGGASGASVYQSSLAGRAGGQGKVMITYTPVACVAPTSVSISGFSTSVCSGVSPGTGTASPFGGIPASYTYLWYKNGVSTGVTASTYDPGPLVANTDIYCAISTGSGCTTNSPVTSIVISGSAPSQPDPVTGNTTPCLGSYDYSVPNVVGVTYNWSFPAGWTQTGGGTSNSVTVNVGATSGSISVTPSNGCGSGPAQTLSVTVNSAASQPSQPGAISGSSAPCFGSAQTYSVPNVAGVTYNWSFPAGWSVSSGGSTNVNVVSVSSTAGTVIVTPSNACGNGPAQTLGVTPQSCTGSIPWSGYPDGVMASYSAGTAPYNMSASVSGSGVTLGDDTPKYTSSDPGSPCYIPGSLALYANVFDNISTAYYNVLMRFNPAGNGSCFSISFDIKDINANETSGSFLDVIEISALDGSGASIPAANIVITVPANTNVSTSGNTRIIRGHNSNSENYDGGIYSTTSCAITSVSVTPPAGMPLQSINIKYRPAYGVYPSCYWNTNPPAKPSFQYISISNLNYTTTSGCTTTLPVELLSFEGNCTEDGNELSWTTASENDNDYFTIERSLYAGDFEAIGKVSGAGTSNQIRNYAFTDPSGTEHNYYYRLKQTDFNGNFTYSFPINIKCLSHGISGQIKVFPVPAIDEINCLFSEPLSAGATLIITDVLGKPYQSINVLNDAETYAFPIDISNLPDGIYLVSVTDPEGTCFKPVRFVKAE